MRAKKNPYFRCPEWKNISEATKHKLELNFKNDGEFWMVYADFINNFDRIDICHLCPDSLNSTSENPCDNPCSEFKMLTFHGEWKKGATAGGSRHLSNNFFMNPQYVVSIKETDSEQDTCSVVISLMQEYRRTQKNFGNGILDIGFAIYKIGEKHLLEKPLKENFFKNNECFATSSSFRSLIEVSDRFELPIGHYLIVPSTWEPHMNGKFFMRVYTKSSKFIVENEIEACQNTVSDKI